MKKSSKHPATNQKNVAIPKNIQILNKPTIIDVRPHTPRRKAHVLVRSSPQPPEISELRRYKSDPQHSRLLIQDLRHEVLRRPHRCARHLPLVKFRGLVNRADLSNVLASVICSSQRRYQSCLSPRQKTPDVPCTQATVRYRRSLNESA
jgi:hypothetical protein